jgi:hypothetical protein
MERYSKRYPSKWQSQYSEEFKRHVCQDFLIGTLTRRQVEHKYGIGNSRLTCWLKEQGYRQVPQTTVPLYMSKPSGTYPGTETDVDIPILVGVHYTNGSSSPPNNSNRATRHFMVIVGTGTNTDGKVYFRFYDPGVYPNRRDVGASPDNKLIFYPSTGMIQGTYRDRVYSITEIFKTN